MQTPRRFRRLALVGSLVLVPLVGACGGEDSADPIASEVAVKDFAFSPKEVNVKAGSTLTWTNEDDFAHSVRIDALEVDGENFGKGQSFEHRFEKPGTYPYICGVHNSMTGTVIVSS